MNLPNKITLSRIGLTIVFMFLLFAQGLTAKVFALFTFTLAVLTDFLDGRIARKMNLENDFGRLMDPIADKILILSAFLAFVEMHIIPAWMAVIIIARELVITGLRLSSAMKGKIIAASLAGKHKTVSQMAAIFSILIFLIIKESARVGWTYVWELWFRRSVFVLMLITIVFTLISGLSYLIRNGDVFLKSNAKTN